MRRPLRVLSIATVSLLTIIAARALVQPVWAQEDSTEPLGLTPTVDLAAQLDVGGKDGFKRRIKIFDAIRRGAKAGEGGPYVHWPLFAFVEREFPLPGYPAVVDGVSPDDGSATAEFRFVVRTSRPELVDAARHAVFDQNLKIRNAKTRLQDIDVFPYPLTEVLASVKSTLPEREWGIAKSGALTAATDDIPITLSVLQENRKPFLEALLAGNLTFSFRLAFKNVIATTATRSTDITENSKAAIETVLTSQNLRVGDPVFQDSKDILTEALKTQIHSSVMAIGPEAPTLIGNLQADLLKLVLAPMKDVDLTDVQALQKNPKLAEQIFGYLQPILEKMSTKKEIVDTTTDRKENEKIKKTEETVKIGIEGAYKAVKGNAEDTLVHTVTKTDRDTLEKKHGVTFMVDKDTGNLKPASIKVSLLTEAWRTQARSLVESAVLARSDFKGYLPDTGVPITFLDNSLNLKATLQGGFSPYARVPLGVALCYFGEDLPEGYAWADGKTKMPNEAWAPVHLRGQPTPNMNQPRILIGGTDGVDHSTIGKLTSPGKLSFNELPLDISGLDIPTKKSPYILTATVNDYKRNTCQIVNYPESSNYNLQCKYSSDIPLSLTDRVIDNKGIRLSLTSDFSSPKTKQEFLYGGYGVLDLTLTGWSFAAVSADSGRAKLAGRISVPQQNVALGAEAAPPHIACRWIVRVK